MQRLVVLLPDVHQVVLPSASAALLAERRRQRGGRHSQPLLQRLRKTALIRVNYSSSDESEQGSSMCSENHHMCSEVHVGRAFSCSAAPALCCASAPWRCRRIPTASSVVQSRWKPSAACRHQVARSSPIHPGSPSLYMFSNCLLSSPMRSWQCRVSVSRPGRNAAPVRGTMI